MRFGSSTWSSPTVCYLGRLTGKTVLRLGISVVTFMVIDPLCAASVENIDRLFAVNNNIVDSSVSKRKKSFFLVEKEKEKEKKHQPKDDFASL
jgi:hypothetical protein